MDNGASETAVFYDHFLSRWHIGDLASIIGLALAVVGIWIAVFQASAAKKQASLAKSAAESARDAADAALNHRRLLDSTAALAESIVRLDEIKAMLADSKAEDTVVRYDAVCAQLVLIEGEETAAGRNHNASRLSVVHKTLRDTQTSTARLSDNIKKLKWHLVYKKLSDAQDELSKLSAQIRNVRN